MKKNMIKIFLVLCVASVSALVFINRQRLVGLQSATIDKPNLDQVNWYVLSVSDQVSQADANLLKFGSGETILIDAGQTNFLLAPQLKNLGVRSIEKILISHPHKDHYNGILSLLDAGITIGSVYLNMPPANICNKEVPWGCDMADLERLNSALRAKNIPVLSSAAGDIYAESEHFKLKALVAHDGISPPIGETDINDLSVILALTVGNTRALFTGDLNQKLGGFLADTKDPELNAQLLKVPHHGTDSLAPNSFFDWVRPLAAFVPAPESLWLSERSRRARDYFAEKKIPTFITGKSGIVKVSISKNGYHISADDKSALSL